MKHIFRFFLILLLVVTASAPLGADRVYLRSGGFIDGQIVGQSRQSLRIKMSNGSIRTVSKGNVKRVRYGTVTEPKKEPAKKEPAKKEPEKKEPEKKEPDAIEPGKKEPVVASDPFSAGQAARASALLPGRGQWKSGRKTAGIVYPALIGLGAIGLYSTHSDLRVAQKEYNNYNNPTSLGGLFGLATGTLTPSALDIQSPAVAFLFAEPYRTRREAVESAALRRRQFGIGILVLYLWSIADAYVFHPGPSATLKAAGRLDPRIWVTFETQSRKGRPRDDSRLSFALMARF